MIKKIPNKYKLLILISLILGFIIALKILTPKSPPQIIKSVPANNQTEVSATNKIIFEFDQPISDKKFAITSYPKFKYQLTTNQNKLEIEPEGRLMYGMTYTIKVTSEEISDLNYALTFTTAPEALPPGSPTYSPEAEKKFYQGWEDQTYKDLPLFDYIPFYSKNFSLDYTDVLTLEVTLKKDTQEIRQEVLNWISSKGVDPKTHKINWKVQE